MLSRLKGEHCQEHRQAMGKAMCSDLCLQIFLKNYCRESCNYKDFWINIVNCFSSLFCCNDMSLNNFPSAKESATLLFEQSWEIWSHPLGETGN